MRTYGPDDRETPYVETEALLAVMNCDLERMRHMIDSMSRVERSIFREQVETLAEYLDEKYLDKS